MKRHYHYKQSLVFFHANDLFDCYNLDYNTFTQEDNNQTEIQAEVSSIFCVKLS